MLRFAADENFHGAIVEGLRKKQPLLDIVRVQDVGLTGTDDPGLLEWAAAHDRLVLTFDVTTMTHHAIARIKAGLSMPGLVEVSPHLTIGGAIDEILLLAEASLPSEWENQIVYLPLK